MASEMPCVTIKVVAGRSRGVMAVAAQIDGRPVGLAVSAFVSVSLDPPLILICLDNSSQTWPRLRTSPSIGVSVIAENQAWLGRQLASRSRDRFADAVFRETQGGGLLLEGAAAQLDCTLEQEIPGGDHVMAVLRVIGMSAESTVAPLVWHDSEFGQVVLLNTPILQRVAHFERAGTPPRRPGEE